MVERKFHIPDLSFAELTDLTACEIEAEAAQNVSEPPSRAERLAEFPERATRLHIEDVKREARELGLDLSFSITLATVAGTGQIVIDLWITWDGGSTIVRRCNTNDPAAIYSAGCWATSNDAVWRWSNEPVTDVGQFEKIFDDPSGRGYLERHVLLRRSQGHQVDAQWNEQVGDWYLVRRAEDGQPLEVVYVRADNDRAYAETFLSSDDSINPFTYVDDLLARTVEGKRLTF